MVIKYSFFFLNLYIACSYQPKIQKWVLISWAASCNWNKITILVSTPMFSMLMIQMKKKTYWNNIMADLNKIQDSHRRNVLCYCIEDIHMVRKHSFVYLNICYSLTNLSYNLSCDTQCSQSNVVITPSFNWHIESYFSWPRYTYVSGSPGKFNHNGIILKGSTKRNVEQILWCTRWCRWPYANCEQCWRSNAKNNTNQYKIPYLL